MEHVDFEYYRRRMEPILQPSLRLAPWMEPGLARFPGVVPMVHEDWLVVDEAYDAQLAYKADRLATRRDDVLRMRPDALPAARELLTFALRHAPKGVREVEIDWDAPLETLSRILQEDFTILQKHGDEHILTAGIVCFPSGWLLADQFERSLTEIHAPLPDDRFDDRAARVVERMFSNVHEAKPMMRATAALIGNSKLDHPNHESYLMKEASQAGFIRVEKQGIVRLPETRAIVFSLHTTLVRLEDLSQEQAKTFGEYFAKYGGNGS